MKLPSILSIVTWLVNNWSKIKPVAIAAWDLIGLQAPQSQKTGAEKEQYVITELQNKFPFLTTSIAKFVINFILIIRRTKTSPSVVEANLKDATKVTI